jgi:hypothetical protein
MRSLRLVLVLSLSLSSLSLAAAHEAKAASEIDAIRSCLAAWGEPPFRSAEEQPFKVLSPTVKVLGVGQDVTDETETDQPQLVLVKPSVNVLTKSSFRLMNPNGWYCFAANVTVLAKSEITAHCRAHLASSREGVSVAGGNKGTEGVTVFGKTVVKRVGCEAHESHGRDDAEVR